MVQRIQDSLRAMIIYLDHVFSKSYDFGIVIIDGNGCLYGILNNKNEAKIKYKFGVNLPNRHNKGGQSQNRMLRLNDETRHNFIKKCCEMACKQFINNDSIKPNVEGIIVSGSGNMKNIFCSNKMLDSRLKSIIFKDNLICVNGKYTNSFYDTLCYASPLLTQYILDKECNILIKYFDTMKEYNNRNKYNNKYNNNKYSYCYGINDCLFSLKCKFISRLILSYNVAFGLNVILLKNKNNLNQGLKLFLTNKQLNNNNNNNNNNNKNNNKDVNGWYIASKMNFIEWLEFDYNYKSFGIKHVELISDESITNVKEIQGIDFVNDYGGIGGILHMAINLVELTHIQDEINNNENDEKKKNDTNLGFDLIELFNLDLDIIGINNININCGDIDKTVWVVNQLNQETQDNIKIKEKKEMSEKERKYFQKQIKKERQGKAKKKRILKNKVKASQAANKYQQFKKKKQEKIKRFQIMRNNRQLNDKNENNEMQLNSSTNSNSNAAFAA